MSKTTAANPVCREGEGVTSILLDGGTTVPLDALAEAHSAVVFGGFADRWPLTKVPRPYPWLSWQVIFHL